MTRTTSLIRRGLPVALTAGLLSAPAVLAPAAAHAAAPCTKPAMLRAMQRVDSRYSEVINKRCVGQWAVGVVYLDVGPGQGNVFVLRRKGGHTKWVYRPRTQALCNRLPATLYASCWLQG